MSEEVAQTHRTARRLLRRLLWGLGILIGLCALAAFVLYRGAQHVPEFYERALTAPSPERQRDLGLQLERGVAELHNDARREGRWEATFTEEQLNAWLAGSLPSKFRDALPDGVSEPRVKITPDRAQVACRFQRERFHAVLSLDVDVYLTDRPNQLAIQVRGVRAGWVPLPCGPLLDEAADAAGKNRVALSWGRQDEDPVGLIDVPARYEPMGECEIHLETLELREGAVYVAGRTKSFYHQGDTP